MSSFTFDEDAFRKIANDAVRNIAVQQTRDLDELRQQYTGRPLDEIRPALQQGAAHPGWHPNRDDSGWRLI